MLLTANAISSYYQSFSSVSAESAVSQEMVPVCSVPSPAILKHLASAEHQLQTTDNSENSPNTTASINEEMYMSEQDSFIKTAIEHGNYKLKT